MSVPASKADRKARRSIVLVGFMGAGKSKIGRLLAARLDLPFIDTDSAIEQSFGLSVAAIFREHGEAAFREAERALISRLPDEEAQVIALGGGAFVDQGNRDILNRAARTVWLDAPFALIMSRLQRSADRPLAANRNETELRTLWAARRDHYAEAHVRVRTADVDPARTVDRILKALDHAKN